MERVSATTVSRIWRTYRDDDEAADQYDDEGADQYDDEAADQYDDEVSVPSGSRADSGNIQRPVDANADWPPGIEDDEYWQSVERDASRGAL
jgi:hypothetical protein